MILGVTGFRRQSLVECYRLSWEAMTVHNLLHKTFIFLPYIKAFLFLNVRDTLEYRADETIISITKSFKD